jgi:putative hemolysin
MFEITLEVFIILLMVLVNGLFAMAEIALVSARRSRLEQNAKDGDSGAQKALALADTPNRFLATVQIGITLVGILAGAFGGATIAEIIAKWLQEIPILASYSKAIGLAIVVTTITYLSLVFGELVPKRMAMNNPEAIARRVAPGMYSLSIISAPLIRFLSFSTELVLRILHVKRNPEPAITVEDVKSMIQTGARSGVFVQTESELLHGVFRLGDRRAELIMTPHTEIEWLNMDDLPEENRRKILASAHSQFPVAQGSLDNLLGIASAKDLLASDLLKYPAKIKQYLKQPIFAPENTPALKVLEQMKHTDVHLAMVIDEFGGFLGLITPQDILEAIVGEDFQNGLSEEHRNADGSWDIEGLLPVDQFAEIFQIRNLPEEAGYHYQTVGGLVTAYLGYIPQVGEKFKWEGLCFEIMEMDKLRVEKVRIYKHNESN